MGTAFDNLVRENALIKKKLREQLRRQAKTIKAFFSSANTALNKENADLEQIKGTLMLQKDALEIQNTRLQNEVGNLTVTNGDLVNENGQLIQATTDAAIMMSKMKPRNRHKAEFGSQGALSSHRNRMAEVQRAAALKE